MPEDLDPIEREWYRQRTEAARQQLQALAPRGTTLFLRPRRDPKFEPASFWLVEVTFFAEKGDRVNFNDFLKDILAAAEQRVIDGTPTYILSWYSPEPDALAEAITRHLGTVIWQDPHAYTYQMTGENDGREG